MSVAPFVASLELAILWDARQIEKWNARRRQVARLNAGASIGSQH